MRSSDLIKRAALLGLVFSIVLSLSPLSGQTRRAAGRGRPTQPPQSKQPAKADAVPRIQLLESPKSRAMAESFDNGSLPEPARLPTGSVDEQATELAKAVSKGDSNSTAALYAAILGAGYGVRDKDGAVLQTAERGQGLVFEWWEVAAVSKLYGDGYGAGLDHLAQSFTRNVAELKGVPLAGELLDGVRKAARSNHPALRFWGVFIVELGRHSDEPYDLLAQVNAVKVRLDAIQIALILSRLTGDLVLAGKQQAARLRLPTETTLHHVKRGADVQFLKERIETDSASRSSPPPQQPCGTNDAQGLVLDANAALSTSLHSRLSGMQGTNVLRNANIVLSLLKFILSYAMLKADLLVLHNPMERTKNTQPGAFNAASVRVWIDNKFQAVNCLRIFLNSMGLDFNLPNNGPVSGVKVVWAGVLGFGEEARDWRDDFLDHFTGGGARPADSVVYFPSPRDGDDSRTDYTDKNGLSAISIAGRPQVRDMSREKLIDVLKVAGVRAWLQLKPTQINDLTSGLSTTVDALGVVNSFAGLDIASGIAGLITEAAYRLNWFPTKSYYFLVKDWEPCTGEWSGTISSSLHLKQTEKERLKTGYERDYEHTYNFDASIAVGVESRGTIDASETSFDDQRTAPNIRTTSRAKGGARYTGKLEVDVRDYGGAYIVRFDVPKMRGAIQTKVEVVCPPRHKWQKPCEGSSYADDWEPFLELSELRGTTDPNRPGEINATRTWKSEDGLTEYSFKINLRRCK